MDHNRHRNLCMALACLLVATLIAVPAVAEQRKIPPLAFKTVSPIFDAVYTPFWVGADPSGATPFSAFSAPVKLPRGSTIDAVSIYYTASGGADVFANLYYLDTAAPDSAFHLIAVVTTSADAATPTPAVFTFAPGADLVVKPGYKYLLTITTQKQAFVWEGRVAFTRP